MSEVRINTPIVSGGRVFNRASDVQKLINKVVTDAVLKAVKNETAKAVKTVPRKTGALKRGLRTTLEQQARKQANKNTIILSLSNEVISALPARYTGAHTIGHPDFNPNFAGGYDKPSTPNTKPINTAEILSKLKEGIKKEINNELRRYQLKVRAN